MEPAPQLPSGDTEETLRAVRRIARALALSSRDLARQHRLTPAQLLCLRLLKDQPALNAGAIAAALSLSPQTMTGLLDRLEARGLATRLRSTSDRRQVLVRLSARGSEALDAAGPLLQDRFVARLEALPIPRRRSLRRALQAIVALLEADRLDAAPLLAPGSRLEPSARHGSATTAAGAEATADRQ
ncbi:MAG TPA: MarR family transcriptional regulator [Gammaproteobacteria bacterium]|nr:MarR family transcriptional regulator [Gammaproteobacteria bacterium]